MFIEILFKIVLFKGGVLIYAEHCTCLHTQAALSLYTAVCSEEFQRCTTFAGWLLKLKFN